LRILKFYEVLEVPAFLYGSECWTVTKQQLQQTESSEMRFLMSVAGYRRTDKEKYRHHIKFKNIQSRAENKIITAELFRKYPKNANIPNPSENIQLSPYRKKRFRSTTDDMDGSIRLNGRSEQANRPKPYS
jgi:hypothetical protein